MEADTIQTHARIEKYYWWFVGRRQILEKMLAKFFFGKNLEILDWGCGTGGNFSVLSKFGQVLGVDVSPEALRFCRSLGFDHVLQAGTVKEFRSQNVSHFDLFTGFDVLEHIEDDRGFLQDIKPLLRPEGWALFTVPAYEFLWSDMDIALRHYRRYTARELKSKLQKAGFKVEKISYFMTFIAPLHIIYRVLHRAIFGLQANPKYTLLEFPRWLNNLFVLSNRFESVLMKFVNFPFGVSVFVLAKKDN